jgi:SH3-like domain-containing protein
MYTHRSRNIAIASSLILGLGALSLIPADPARTEKVAISSTTSTETIAAIDAMLGAGQSDVAAPAAPQRDDTDRLRGTAPIPTASLQPAALQTEISQAPPAIDPSLRPDAIGSRAVNLRVGPSTGTATVAVLQPGQALHTGETQNGWTAITLDDGTTGWVYSRYLASVAATLPAEIAAPAQTDEPAPRKAVVSGGDGNLEGRTARIESRLAVFSAPDGETLFRTEPGERVRILDSNGDWLKIRTADGTIGWIQRAG